MRSNDTVIHHDGPHADQYVVFNGATMHDGVVSDRYVASDHGLRSLIRTVDHGAVLNVRIISYGNGVHISANHGVEPNRAVLSHDHLPYHDGIVGQKTVFPKPGLKTPNFLNNGHFGSLNLTLPRHSVRA